MNINDLNHNLDEIAERYQSDSFVHRMGKMFTGIRQPKNTKAHKEALIEGQRLSAPVSAVIIPLLVIMLLVVFSSGSKTREREQFVIYRQADEPIVYEDPKPSETPVAESDETLIPDDFFTDSIQPVITKVPQPETVMDNTSPAVMPDFKSGPKIAWDHSGMGAGRGEGVVKYDGTPTEDSVMKALRWLKKNQNADGSWNNNKCAMTGLAVLTFLAHDELPGKSSEFGDTVQKAIEFLMSGQDPQSGLFSHQDGHCYSHPIATYAMCEAYGMTLNPNAKRAAELALVPIIRGQHPTGGWTYKMDPAVDKATGQYRDDTSYMGWCAQALKAAKMAGIKAEGLDKAVKLAVKGFKNNAAPDGGFGYVSKSGTHGLTSVGALCMELLGAGDDSAVRNSLAVMDHWRIGPYAAENKVGSSPQYYFYYATQSKFNFGGKRWKQWDIEMKASYLSAQRVERNAIKDPKGIERDIGWWENGDKHTDRPVMDTCLAALQLMVYYRNLPTTMAKAFAVDPGILVSAPTAPADIQVIIEGNGIF